MLLAKSSTENTDMKTTIHSYSAQLLVFLLLSVASIPAFAQNPVINQAGEAIKNGNVKDLVKHLNDRIDMNIDGVQQSYSNAQAEFVLKDFFQKNPPRNFEINHLGGPPDGMLQYAIGSYSSASGNYRVVIRVRKVKDEYRVFNLDFSKE
jgi:hypothetical protein